MNLQCLRNLVMGGDGRTYRDAASLILARNINAAKYIAACEMMVLVVNTYFNSKIYNLQCIVLLYCYRF